MQNGTASSNVIGLTIPPSPTQWRRSSYADVASRPSQQLHLEPPHLQQPQIVRPTTRPTTTGGGGGVSNGQGMVGGGGKLLVDSGRTTAVIDTLVISTVTTPTVPSNHIEFGTSGGRSSPGVTVGGPHVLTVGRNPPTGSPQTTNRVAATGSPQTTSTIVTTYGEESRELRPVGPSEGGARRTQQRVDGDTVTPMDDSAFQQQGGGKGKASSSGKGPSDAASGSPGGKGGKSSPVPAGGPKGGSTKGGSSSQAKGGGGPGGLRKGPGDPVTASSNPPQQQAFQGFPPGAAAPSMSDTASNGGDFATPRSTSGHHSTGEWTARTGGNTAQNTAQNTGNQNQQYTAAEWAAWMGK